MARVTKINVGGTNYDIAHEGELKNSGFEVVTSLPTTGLFAGREVMYNGKKYVYSSGWQEEITANTMYEANMLWGGRNIAGGFSPVDAAMMSELSSNVIAFPNPEGISIEYSRDGGVTWLDYGATDDAKVNLFTSNGFCVCGNSTTTTLGMQLRITITPAICGFYTSLNKIILFSYNFGSSKSWCTLKGLTSINVNAGNEDDSFYSTIFEKERISGWPAYNVINFNQIYTAPEVNNHDKWFYRLRLVFGFDEVSNANIRPLVITQLRFFGIDRFTLPSNLAKYNHLYTYDWKQNALFPAKVESKEVINFDINNIEPTQTGSSVSKTSTWLWQYLTQAVNWLKANNVRLSSYNTKIAALEQANNTKLDKRAYNQVYTNCGYTNITSSTTGALIIELPFAPNGDTRNSMTYIELNVYSHRKGCSKYIIGVYSYNVNSEYEWSVYSYMGYNYFSSIAQARRTDNNNIVIVLGNFTDVHKNEHFSISRIVTGFNRNTNDTDQFLIYTDSTSSNYTSLKDSSYIPQVISYNDLTDTPTLAAVATSGDYNDLLNRPTFSGSYNDLTDTPTLAAVATSGDYNDLLNRPTFSGSYNDLTDTPTLAAVATSGDYNDLLNRPTFSGSYNDLTDTPTLAAVATSGDYNDLLNRPTFSGSYNDLTDTPNLATVATSGDYNDLSNLPTIPSSFADLSGNVVDEISDGSITNAKLANSSMTLNGITVSLGHSYALPWQISWNSTLYKARIMGNWLQIYHNNQWVDTFYLLRQEPIQPTNVTQITSLSDLSWYNEQVSEYEIDSNTTFKLLKGDVSIAAQLLQSQFTANQLTLNLYPIPSGSYNKGALDKVISDLKDNNFAVFVENDLDTILTSGSDFCVRIKISKVPTYKAIIECYVAR